MTDQNRQLVRDFFADRLKNDPDVTRSAFAPHASFRFAGAFDQGNNVLTQARGAEQIEQIAIQVIQTWRWERLEICSLVIEDDRAAVRSLLWGTHVPSNKPFESEMSDHIVIRDGQIIEMVEFVDTRLMERYENGTVD